MYISINAFFILTLEDSNLTHVIFALYPLALFLEESLFQITLSLFSVPLFTLPLKTLPFSFPGPNAKPKLGGSN